jgi:tetratricopeptide (TPR) repeat protein
MTGYSKALSYHEQAIEIRQKAPPPNHPGLAQSYNNIGWVYSKMREHSKALSYYQKALEIHQTTLPPKHPDFANSYNNIGLQYLHMGKYSKTQETLYQFVTNRKWTGLSCKLNLKLL